MSSFSKMYWRSSGVPAWGLIFLSVAAIGALIAAENMRARDQVVVDNYATMVAAASKMREGMQLLQPLRAQLRPISPESDPQRSGIIGVTTSDITTTRGGLESKQTTINPNWAAVGVKLLADAGVGEGDLVAVTVSGSFPAINLAIYSAIEAIGADAVIVASGSSSQYGANVPGLTWIDMERELRDAGIFSLKSLTASIGGVEDRGADISPEGIASIRQSIDRAGIPLLEPGSYQEAVANRIAIFREHSADRPIKAFVNVGGGATIVGPPGIDSYFSSGLITSVAARAFAVETVMGYFLRENIPAIHMIGIKNMAERHGLPVAPVVEVPVGNGGIYSATSYRRGLALGLGIALFGLTWLIVRSARITSLWRRTSETSKGVRPMV